jgi:hypothetical protein
MKVTAANMNPIVKLVGSAISTPTAGLAMHAPLKHRGPPLFLDA